MSMTIYHTQALHGEVTPPSSKSAAIRALFFALLAQGDSQIHHMLEAEDVHHAIAVCHALGALTHTQGDHLTVKSAGAPFQPVTQTIYSGNSGITTRFILPLLGLRANTTAPITLDCGPQMRARPIGALLTALRTLGMEITCLDKPDALPVKITGPLLGGKVTIQEPISQYLSALLIALPLAPHDSEVRMADLAARPYVDMTLDWLKRLGVECTHQYHDHVDTFLIPGRQQYRPFNETLPGDFSNASYFIAAGAMFPGKIILKGLDLADTQGDKQFIDIVKAMGGDIVCHPDEIIVTGGNPLTGISINAKEMPDLLPTLAVLGTFAQGTTHIHSVPQARLKETDRIHSMTEGLRRMGAHVEEKPDGMIVHSSTLTGTSVKGYGDHRTVMALTLAGMRASGSTVIDEAASIRKTFPAFFNQIIQLGGHITGAPHALS